MSTAFSRKILVVAIRDRKKENQKKVVITLIKIVIIQLKGSYMLEKRAEEPKY